LSPKIAAAAASSAVANQGSRDLVTGVPKSEPLRQPQCQNSRRCAGHGETITGARGITTCPVKAIKSWLLAAGISEVAKGGRLCTEALPIRVSARSLRPMPSGSGSKQPISHPFATRRLPVPPAEMHRCSRCETCRGCRVRISSALSCTSSEAHIPGTEKCDFPSPTPAQFLLRVRSQ
jgi:hypothetical protein